MRWRRSQSDVAKYESSLTIGDLFDEAVAGILQRPARAVVTALGTVLGVGVFVAVLGLTATASSQISSRFTTLMATEVTVTDKSGADPTNVPLAFPRDADRRVGIIPGVQAAGVHWTVANRSVTGVVFAGRQPETEIPVVAASPGYLRALHGEVQEGRLFDDFHNDGAEQVAVVGAAAARRLGIPTLTMRPAILIDGAPFLVVGVLDSVDRNSDLLFAVVVPRQTAENYWGPPSRSDPAKMTVDTSVGAAQTVAEQVALALRPDAPELFMVTPPPDPRSLRDQVSNDLGVLFILLAVVCVVIGALGIANTTMVGVLERTHEIGLRRALGARRGHIAAQFLLEAATLGTAGGLAGASLGIGTVVIVAIAQDWTPVVATWTLACGPVIGSLVGLLAGAYPSIRAARIEPVEAFRR